MADKLLKKVELLGENSSPEERGHRLRRLRNLANLSRKEFCDLSELNINTLKGWEIGRYGGLPRDGALRILSAIKQKKIFCSLEWLLHGEGNDPSVENNINQQLIISEIELFEKLILQPILSYQISDDGLSPYYESNYWVAGKEVDLTEVNKFLGKICIVKLADQILVRKVQKGKSAGSYNLFCLNPDTSCEPIIVDVQILALALIDRVYCP